MAVYKTTPTKANLIKAKNSLSLLKKAMNFWIKKELFLYVR